MNNRIAGMRQMIASVTVGSRNAGLVKNRTPSTVQIVNIQAVNAASRQRLGIRIQ